MIGFSTRRTALASASSSLPRLVALMILGLVGLGLLSIAVAQGSTDAADPQRELHVDPSSGSDAGAGTEAEPLATISEGIDRALRNRAAGEGTRILLHPGTYRETVSGYYDESRGAPIVVEAVAEGQAVVSGSEVYRDWSCDGAICEHEWSFDWGTSSDPWPEVELEPLGLRREMVFLDGERMAQRASMDDLQAEPGTFYVDEGRDRIYLHLPEGTDLESTLVEVAERSQLFRTQTLHDVVIDGVVFQHAATPVARAAVYIVEQDGVTIRDVTVRDNNWDGLNLALGSDVVVRNTSLLRNGGNGLGSFRNTRVLVEDSETIANNWRGAAGDLYGWSVGNKFIEARDLTIRRHTSRENLSRGLWLDWDVQNVVLEDVTSCDNLLDGLFVEASPGPVEVRDSTFCDNGGAGILTSAIQQLTLVENSILLNGDAQIRIAGDFDVRIQDRDTGEQRVVNSEEWYWRDNEIEGLPDTPLITSTFPESRWRVLMASSDIDDTEYRSGTAAPFAGPGGGGITFLEWQVQSGQDRNSSYSP